MNEKHDIRQDLSAYLDGQLDASRAEQVAEAVAVDERLARELSQLEATRRLVRQLPRRRPGEDFVSQVLAAAERRELMVAREQAEESPLGWRRYLAVAAVLLISVGLGVLATVVMWTPGTSGQTVGRGPDASEAGPVDAGGARPVEAEVAVADPERPGPVDSPILLVEIRTSNVSNTSREVISKVLEANGLRARSQGPAAGAMVWQVEVPRDEVHKVKKDLSSLPSRQIVMKDADYAEVRDILASVDVKVGPEVRGAESAPARDASAMDAAGDDPRKRIDEILGQDDPPTSNDAEGADAAPDAEVGDVRSVRPMIIKIITEDEESGPDAE